MQFEDDAFELNSSQHLQLISCISSHEHALRTDLHMCAQLSSVCFNHCFIKNENVINIVWWNGYIWVQGLAICNPLYGWESAWAFTAVFMFGLAYSVFPPTKRMHHPKHQQCDHIVMNDCLLCEVPLHGWKGLSTDVSLHLRVSSIPSNKTLPNKKTPMSYLLIILSKYRYRKKCTNWAKLETLCMFDICISDERTTQMGPKHAPVRPNELRLTSVVILTSALMSTVAIGLPDLLWMSIFMMLQLQRLPKPLNEYRTTLYDKHILRCAGSAIKSCSLDSNS